MIVDRRKTKRAKLPNIAMAVVNGNKIEAMTESGMLFGKIYDISNDGACVKLDRPLEAGDKVSIKIRILKTDIEFIANIIHSERRKDASYVGLLFDWEKTPSVNKMFLKDMLKDL